MNRSRLWLFQVVSLCCLGSTDVGLTFSFEIPWLGTTSVFGNEYFYYAKNTFDEDYAELKNRFNLNLQARQFLLGLQFRTQNYSDLEAVPFSELKDEHDLTLDKRFLEFTQGPVVVRAGDSYLSLGRGLVFTIQKNESLDIDDALDGGMFRLATQPFEVILAGGTIERGLPTFDPQKKDEIYAGRLQGNLPHHISIGASYAWSKVYEMDLRQNEYVCYGGDLCLRLPKNIGDFYFEYAELQSELSDDPLEFLRIPDGSGLYAAWSSSYRGLSALVEYKDYENFEYPKTNPQYTYNLPPSADREDEANPHNDILGYRARLAYFIMDIDTSVYASYGQFEDHEGVMDMLHIYAGGELNLDRLYLSASFGERETEERVSGVIETTEDRFVTEAEYRITDQYSVNFFVETKHKVELFTFASGLPAQRYTTDLNRSYAGFSISPYLTANVHFAWDFMRDGKSDELWAGELAVTPIQQVTVKVLYGALPGGLICSGGMCRTEPDFEGYKIETSIRF